MSRTAGALFTPARALQLFNLQSCVVSIAPTLKLNVRQLPGIASAMLNDRHRALAVCPLSGTKWGEAALLGL